MTKVDLEALADLAKDTDITPEDVLAKADQRDVHLYPIRLVSGEIIATTDEIRLARAIPSLIAELRAARAVVDVLREMVKSTDRSFIRGSALLLSAHEALRTYDRVYDLPPLGRDPVSRS